MSIGRWHNSSSYFTTFNDVSIFTMDTNIFKLHSSTLFLVGVMRLIQSVITGYLLTSFSDNFLAVKTPLISLQNII